MPYGASAAADARSCGSSVVKLAGQSTAATKGRSPLGILHSVSSIPASSAIVSTRDRWLAATNSATAGWVSTARLSTALSRPPTVLPLFSSISRNAVPSW